MITTLLSIIPTITIETTLFLSKLQKRYHERNIQSEKNLKYYYLTLLFPNFLDVN